MRRRSSTSCARPGSSWVGRRSRPGVAVFFRETRRCSGSPRNGAPRGRRARPDPGGAREERRVLVRPARYDRAGRRGALPALWELVWAGEVTNDAWTPFASAAATASRSRSGRPRRFSAGGRPRSRLPRDVGRSPAGCSQSGIRARSPSSCRSGREIVTRDGVRAEGIPGGYSAVYGELKALETLGSCRRGYFVEGLAGRSSRSAVQSRRPWNCVLAMRSPVKMSPSWPRPTRRSRTARGLPGRRERARAARVAGAYVVLIGGEAVLFVERGGKTLVPLRDPDPDWLRPAPRCARRAREESARDEAAGRRAARRRAGGGDGCDAAPRRGRLRRGSTPRRAAAVVATIGIELGQNLTLPARVCRQGARQRRHEVSIDALLAERPHLSRSLELLDAVFDYLDDVDIRVYRMSSSTVPHGTHPDLPQLDYRLQIGECEAELARLGAKARRLGLRLSTHPGQYSVLSSPDPDREEGAAGRRAGRAAAQCARDGPRGRRRDSRRGRVRRCPRLARSVGALVRGPVRSGFEPARRRA